MNGKKLLLASLSAALLVGAAVPASFAATHDNRAGGPGGRPHHRAFSPEIVYVRMLKQFDTNGDMKISKDELKAGVDKVFDQIDTNKDGEITPGELRAYRQERVKAWKAEHAKASNDTAKADQADDNGGKHHGKNQHGRFMREAMIRTTLLFQRIDTDENGQISKQEAENAADKLFARMDRNHDGVISLDDMPNRPLF